MLRGEWDEAREAIKAVEAHTKANLRKVRKRAYYLDNKERLLRKQKEYYEKNKGRVLAANKEWKRKNHQRWRGIWNAWRRRNLEKHREWSAAWLNENRDRKRATNNLWKRSNPVRVREQCRKDRKRAVGELRLWYVAAKMRESLRLPKSVVIPMALLKAKAAHLKIKRLLKEKR